MNEVRCNKKSNFFSSKSIALIDMPRKLIFEKVNKNYDKLKVLVHVFLIISSITCFSVLLLQKLTTPWAVAKGVIGGKEERGRSSREKYSSYSKKITNLAFGKF